eukprot:1773600-Ditylum_brightwellii.AAC.1
MKEVDHLHLEKGKWTFLPRDGSASMDLPNLGLTYQLLLDSQLLVPGWNTSFLPAVAAAHVSAQ